MEVTRKNFEKVLENLPKILEKAQFITFDTEFTGLKVEGASNINFFDTLDEFYLKDRLKAETFIAIQFGLVAFFYNDETQKYTHEAFNFYTFPSSRMNVNFTCQNRSIEFLVQHNFDFNKLFKEGIPYLRNVEVEQLLKKLKEKSEKNNYFETSKGEISPEHMPMVTSINLKIKEILSSKRKESFVTEKYNSFLRKIIYNSVQNDFGTKVFLETNKDETMTITVGLSAEEIKEKQNIKFLEEKKNIMSEAGFSQVVKLIIESKKLLIGHNLLLDLLFTINQFLVPLPNSYSEFKELVTFLFPKIIDTKHMATNSVFNIVKDTSLYALIDTFEANNKIPEVEVTENGKGYSKKDNLLHEAAYDAYLTGLCFLAMAEQLGNCNVDSNIFRDLPQSPLLASILNKLSTPKLCDIFCMNIGGTDKEPDRQGVYHLTFPKEWIREDITNLFKDCGFVYISWINNTSAFVQVKKEYISEVEKNLLGSKSNYSLCTYNEFKNGGLSTSEFYFRPYIRSQDNNDKTPKKNNVSLIKNSPEEQLKKRKVEEDIGEVIERPLKKQLLNKN